MNKDQINKMMKQMVMKNIKSDMRFNAHMCDVLREHLSKYSDKPDPRIRFIIGIDRDYLTESYNRLYEKRMKLIGKIILKKRTKHGYHWKIHITDLEILRFINADRMYVHELRFFLGDDSIRNLKDVFKMWHGYTMTDLLFTKKWKGW